MTPKRMHPPTYGVPQAQYPNMTSLSLARVRSWYQSTLGLLFSKRLGSSGLVTDSKEQKADHASAVDGPFCNCPGTCEHNSTPRHQVDDILRTGSSCSTPPSSLSGLLPKTHSTDVRRRPKSRLVSKMITTLRYRAPQSIPNSNSYDPANRMDTPPDLTDHLTRIGEYATSCGGLSDIWRCDLRRNGGVVVVAVKSIRSHVANEEETNKKSRRLQSELEIWLKLRHDNIVPLYGTSSGFGPFVAMVCPWYENGSLSSYLESVGKALSVVDRFRLLSDVSAGLQYLHSCSIVHGDLTGSNVLISSGGRAHLSDFGLSIVLVELMATSYFTSAFNGAVRWIAPELLVASEEDTDIIFPTTHSDIYSFGCIMFQVLTGKPPYAEYNRDAQVVIAISHGKKPSRPISSAISDQYWKFILKCWSKDRPSAQQVDAYIKGEFHSLRP